MACVINLLSEFMNMNTKIQKQKAVIFDLGNVLVSVRNELTLKLFASHLAQTVDNETLEKELYGFAPRNEWGRTMMDIGTIHHHFHKGEISAAQLFEDTKRRLPFKNTLTGKLFRAYWPARHELRSNELGIVRLMKKHLRYMLSDTNELDVNWINDRYPELFAEFDKCFFSHEQRVDKYDLQAWKNILEVSQLPSQSHIFIDDREDHVRRAKSLGMTGIVYKSAGQMVRELTRAGYL